MRVSLSGPRVSLYGHCVVQWSSLQNLHFTTPFTPFSLSREDSSWPFSDSSLLATKFIQISSVTTLVSPFTFSEGGGRVELSPSSISSAQLLAAGSGILRGQICSLSC